MSSQISGYVCGLCVGGAKMDGARTKASPTAETMAEINWLKWHALHGWPALCSRDKQELTDITNGAGMRVSMSDWDSSFSFRPANGAGMRST